MGEIQRCQALVFHPGGIWRGSKCSRLGKLESGGSFYCSQHLLENVEARRAKARKEMNVAFKVREKIWAAETLEKAERIRLLYVIRQGEVEKMIAACREWERTVAAVDDAKGVS